MRHHGRQGRFPGGPALFYVENRDGRPVPWFRFASGLAIKAQGIRVPPKIRVLLMNRQDRRRQLSDLSKSDAMYSSFPSDMRAALGIPDGGRVVARLVDGTVVLEPISIAIKRAQDYVRQFVPEGVSLADELIAERRAAADHE